MDEHHYRIRIEGHFHRDQIRWLLAPLSITSDFYGASQLASTTLSGELDPENLNRLLMGLHFQGLRLIDVCRLDETEQTKEP